MPFQGGTEGLFSIGGLKFNTKTHLKWWELWATVHVKLQYSFLSKSNIDFISWNGILLYGKIAKNSNSNSAK